MTFPKKRTDKFVFLSWLCPEVLETGISVLSFEYFWTVRIEKQICKFLFWEKFGSKILIQDLLTFSLVKPHQKKTPQNTGQI